MVPAYLCTIYPNRIPFKSHSIWFCFQFSDEFQSKTDISQFVFDLFSNLLIENVTKNKSFIFTIIVLQFHKNIEKKLKLKNV